VRAAVPLPLGLLALALATGCTALYDDSCGPESRQIAAVGVVMTSPVDTLVQADLQAGESRDPDHRSVYWLIEGAALRNHINRAFLVASEDTSTHLFPLTGGLAAPDYAMEGELSPYTGPVDFNVLYNRFRNGGLTVVLETDLEHGVLVVPLSTLVEDRDWDRAHCS